MISDYDVREKMAAVLENRLRIVDFARWVMANSWNMHLDSSASAVSLVSEIHLLLSERDDYLIDDSAFLAELLKLYENAVVSVTVDIDEPSVQVKEAEVFLTSLSETKTIHAKRPAQTVYADRAISPSPRLSLVPVRL